MDGVEGKGTGTRMGMIVEKERQGNVGTGKEDKGQFLCSNYIRIGNDLEGMKRAMVGNSWFLNNGELFLTKIVVYFWWGEYCKSKGKIRRTRVFQTM